jgi:formylglycine-generating enzyme required for sulfatase activity
MQSIRAIGRSNGLSNSAPTGEGHTARAWISRLDDHPIIYVTCRDAEAYVDWASKEPPTEAEWEFATRGRLEGAEFAR